MTGMGVFISSCARDRDVEHGALNTWIERWGDQVEHYMILGQGNTYVNDCDWIVDVADSYDLCSWKVYKAAEFAVKNDMPYIFKCDLDTYVCVPRLLKYDPKGKDYIGFRCGEGHAAGGNGYLLSNKACEILLNHAPAPGYQDVWVNNVLSYHGIECVHEGCFAGQLGPWGNGVISMHLGVSGQKFNPQTMQMCHDNCLDALHVDYAEEG